MVLQQCSVLRVSKWIELRYRVNHTVCYGITIVSYSSKSTSKVAHRYTSYMEREFIFLYHFPSHDVLTFLCYRKQIKGITLKIAGNNHLVPVQRVTDEDLQVLAFVLHSSIFVTGEFFLSVFDVLILWWFNINGQLNII